MDNDFLWISYRVWWLKTYIEDLEEIIYINTVANKGFKYFQINLQMNKWNKMNFSFDDFLMHIHVD